MAKRPEADPTAICALLAPGDANISQEVTLAITDAGRYIERFAKRLAERGIDKPSDKLPIIALLDALIAADRLAAIDHNFAAEDVQWNVARVVKGVGLDSDTLFAWYDEDKLASYSTEATLKKIGQAFAAYGHALVSIDHGADEHPVTVIPFDRVDELKPLVQSFGAKLRSWSPTKRPPEGSLPKPVTAKPPRVHESWKAKGSHSGDDAGNGRGFLVVDSDSSSFVDLTTWPPTARVLLRAYVPRVAWHATRDEQVLDGTSYDSDNAVRSGLLVVRRDGVDRSIAEALDPAILIERIAYVGDAIIVYPSETTLRHRVLHPGTAADRPLLLEPGGDRFQPMGDLAAAEVAPFGKGTFPPFLSMGQARTGDGTDVVIWQAQGFERRENRFVHTFDLGDVPVGTSFPAAAAEGDGFFVVVGQVVREVRRNRQPVTRVPKLQSAYQLSPGPHGTVLIVLGRDTARDPCLAILDPLKGRYKVVPPHMFRVRGDDFIGYARYSAATERLCILYQDEVRSVAMPIIDALPWFDEAPSRAPR